MSVEFQPIIDLVAGRPAAEEAPLRRHHPVRGTVPPPEIIPIAESTGMIVPVGRCVLDQACLRVTKWRKTLPDLRVAVDVSVHQLRELGFATDVAAAMARADLSPAAPILEVTESALIADNDGTIETLEILQTLGIDIELGKAYDLNVVAEGIEDEAQLQRRVEARGTSSEPWEKRPTLVGLQRE